MPRLSYYTTITDEERLAIDIQGMDDSKKLVQSLLSQQVTDEDSLDTIYRNYRHLEVVSVRPNVVESGTDISPYLNVVNEAKQYLESKSYVVDAPPRPARPTVS